MVLKGDPEVLFTEILKPEERKLLNEVKEQFVKELLVTLSESSDWFSSRRVITLPRKELRGMSALRYVQVRRMSPKQQRHVTDICLGRTR